MDGKNDNSDYKLEDILSEYRYDATVSKKRDTAPQAFDVDVDITDSAAAANERLSQLLDDWKMIEQDISPLPRTITKPHMMPEPIKLENPLGISEEQKEQQTETVPEVPEDSEVFGEVVIDQSVFGPPEEFTEIFSPSDEFMGNHEDDHIEAVPEQPRKNIFQRAAERSRKLKETAKSPAEAAAALEPFVRSLTYRTMAAFLLNIPILYISLSHRLPFSSPKTFDFLITPYMYLLFVLAGQILVMLCAADILAEGVADIFRLRPSVNSGVAAAATASMAHVFSIFAFGETYHAYLPYCAVSSIAVLLSLWSSRLKYGARLRTYMVAKNAAPSQVVTMEDRLWDDTSGITKRVSAPDGFVEQTESPDNVEKFFNFFMPLALIAGFLLALLISVGVGEPRRFFWAWAAIMSCVTPFSALFAFTLPFNVVSKRLATVGGALAGWAGARLLSRSDVAVLTDSDVFPAGTVSLNGLKVFGSHSFDKVISYATSVVSASGSELSKAFSDLVKGDNAVIRGVREFEHYEGGGMGAFIDNDRVYIGSYNFMVSMSISMPKELNIKNAVFIAINLELSGIFAVNYTTPNGIKQSLSMLNRRGMLPLFAVRDFNITASSLKSRFKLDEKQMDYPVIEERLTLSDKNRVVLAKPAAVSGREGLLTYAECIVGGVSLKKVANVNLMLSVACAAIGLFLMFYFASSEAASSASPVNVLLFQLLWGAPTVLISGWAGRY